MSERGSRVDWLIFLGLGFIWGSSYLFIKLAVDDFGTFTLVFLRLLVGAALLWVVRPDREAGSAPRAAHLRAPARDGRHQHHDPVPAHHLGRAVGRLVAGGHPDVAGAALRHRAVRPLPARRAAAGQRRRGARRRVHRGHHRDEPRAHGGGIVAQRRAGPARRGIQLRLRRGLLAAQRPRAPADDPGGLPGDVRDDHRRARSRSCSSTRGRPRRTRRRSSRSCGSACSVPGSRTSPSSGCSPPGARRGRRSWPT